MKSFSILRVALVAAIGIGMYLALPAYAQNAGNVRVVRLSLAEGQVLVSHAGTNIWEEAPANLPLQEGDSLATQNGRAEIEFENGATGYLAENSVLQFTQLGYSSAGRVTELTLTQGAGTFYANLTSQGTFQVQALTFDVAIPQRAEFRVDGFKDGAAVEVFQGDVKVSTTKGSTSLEKGQSVAVHQSDLQTNFAIGSLPTAEDAFDQWVTEQGEMIRAGSKNTLSYINSPNVYGLSDLSRYGTWVNIAGFGNSWRPFNVGFTWTPYFNGRFILDPILGWIWVSSEPWGWTPYHFGSWLLAPNLGWVWVPGGPAGLKQWEPARVDWVNVGNQVGWVAKSPDDREGAPANVAHGVITRAGQTPGNMNETHEIMSGKDVRNVTPLRQPPIEFASHPAPGTQHSGTQSTIRLAPRMPDNNASIVYDSGSHTYINGDRANEGQPGIGNSPPVAPAMLMPRPGTQALIPRTTPQPPPSSQRVIFPPGYPTPLAPRVTIPRNAVIPARPLGVPPVNAPLNSPLRPMVPPLIVPRPMTNSSTAPRPIAPPPVEPRPIAPPTTVPTRGPEQERGGTARHPETRTQQPASPQNPPDRR